MLARQFNSHLTRGHIVGLHFEASAFLSPKTQAQSGWGVASAWFWIIYVVKYLGWQCKEEGDTAPGPGAHPNGGNFRGKTAGDCSPPLRCVRGHGF